MACRVCARCDNRASVPRRRVCSCLLTLIRPINLLQPSPQVVRALTNRTEEVRELQASVQSLRSSLTSAEALIGQLQGEAAAEREGREDATAALVSVQTAIQQVRSWGGCWNATEHAGERFA